jgi:hypothetical protein
MHLQLHMPLHLLQLQPWNLKRQIETNSEEKLVPPSPPVPKTAPSENISVPTNAPAAESATAPATASAAAAAPAVQSEETNKTDSEVKPGPLAPSVDEIAPFEDIPAPTDAPATASAAALAAAATVKSEETNKTNSEEKLAPLVQNSAI